MISQYEVTGLLCSEIPSLANRYCPTKASLEVYAFMNYFSDYTTEAVSHHEMNTAHKCFLLAEQLLREGDRLVRSLVENIFVYSFSSMLNCDQKERAALRSIIPASLYHIYLRQVSTTGV